MAKDVFGWLDEVDEQTKDARVEGTEVDERLSFPYAHVHGDGNNEGEGGGLLIKDEIAPPDIVYNDKVFKPVQIKFGKNLEDGRIAKKYRLVVLAFDHDENGNPRTWRDMNDLDDKGNGKLTFTVLCAIWDAFSEIKPFRIRFKGPSNAIRMANHIRNFDQHVLGTILKERRKKDPNAKPFCRHFFLMPVIHEAELLGSGKQKSWGCPVQEMEPGWTLKGNKPQGKSVLVEAYGKKPEKIQSLYIGNNTERMKLFAEWIKKYAKDAVKLVKRDGSVDGAANNGSNGHEEEPAEQNDFVMSKADKPMSFVGKDGTGAGQFGFMRKMLTATHNADWIADVKKLIKQGVLVGDPDFITKPNDDDSEPDLPNFTISGASKYIEILIERKENLKSERRDTAPEKGNLLDQDEEADKKDPWDEEDAPTDTPTPASTKKKPQQGKGKPKSEPDQNPEPDEEAEADDDDEKMPWD